MIRSKKALARGIRSNVFTRDHYLWFFTASEFNYCVRNACLNVLNVVAAIQFG